MNNIIVIVSVILIIEVIIFFLLLKHYREKNNDKNSDYNTINETENYNNINQKEDIRDKEIDLLNISNNEKNKYSNEDLNNIDDYSSKLKSSEQFDTQDYEDYFVYEEDGDDHKWNDDFNKEEKQRIVLDEMPKNIDSTKINNNNIHLSDPANWHNLEPTYQEQKRRINDNDYNNESVNCRNNQYLYTELELECIKRERLKAFKEIIEETMILLVIACVLRFLFESYNISGRINNRFEETKKVLMTDVQYNENNKSRTNNRIIQPTVVNKQNNKYQANNEIVQATVVNKQNNKIENNNRDNNVNDCKDSECKAKRQEILYNKFKEAIEKSKQKQDKLKNINSNNNYNNIYRNNNVKNEAIDNRGLNKRDNNTFYNGN